MKLLFDNNLSYKLVARLNDIFPNSSHVMTVELDEAEDLVMLMNQVSIIAKER